MSEILLKFLLSELRTVRVGCKICKAVVEVDYDALTRVFASNACPACHRRYSPLPTTEGHCEPKELFAAIRRAIILGVTFSEEITVEFALPSVRENA